MSDSEDEDVSRPSQDIVIKLCLLGNGASGKTSIATVLSQNSFSRQYAQTVGLDFFRRREQLPNGKVVQLQIWDVGGQQIGGSLLPTYISGAHGVLFVYDVTNQQSFDDLEDWIKTAKNVLATSDLNSAAPVLADQSNTAGSTSEQSEPKKSPHFALVGNKTDLQHMVAVSPEKHARFAMDNGMSSHLVCASRADGVELMAKKITAAILNIKLERHDLEQSQPVVAAGVIQPPRGPPSSSSQGRSPNSSNPPQESLPATAASNSNSCSVQ